MKRDAYGQLSHYYSLYDRTMDQNQYHNDLWLEARCMINMAVNKNLIPGAYDDISWDKKKRAEGDACHLEIYDIALDARHVLLCIRKTEGSRYGVRTTSKRYVIISAHGRSVRVTEANKAKAAKAAKQAGDELGQALMVVMGKKKLASSSKSTERTCYKIAAIGERGTPVSVYDGSLWAIGVTRRETATATHDGGFYVFPSISSAIRAWGERVVFADEWMKTERYTLLECDCKGRSYLHDNNKLCISTVKPVREIAHFLPIKKGA